LTRFSIMVAMHSADSVCEPMAVTYTFDMTSLSSAAIGGPSPALSEEKRFPNVTLVRLNK
jgi:hypothetical protein